MDHAVRLPNGRYRVPRAIVELIEQGRDLPPAPIWKKKILILPLPSAAPANAGVAPSARRAGS